MLTFFEQYADLLRESLAYLELDEGCEPEGIQCVEVAIISAGNCIVSFPEIGIGYFASNWDHWTGRNADWLFSRQ